MTARHTAETAPRLVDRIAEQIARHMADLRFLRTAEAAQAAAFRILADEQVAAGQRALPVITALDARHQPRSWAGATVIVCRACETAWPCRDRELLDAARPPAPARPRPAPAGPSGLPTDEFAAVTA